MANFHSLIDEISNRQLERVSETRLLGVKFQGNLKWNDHVKGIANDSYGVVCTLQKLKHFTDQTFTYAESLVLSPAGPHFCDLVCSPLPGHLLKRLQKIEFTGRYVNDIGTGSPNAVSANNTIRCIYIYLCSCVFESFWKGFESDQRRLTLLVSNGCLT